MVLDTSALLAVLFQEEKGPQIATMMQEAAAQLRMSTVNLAEVLILLEDRQPHLFEELREMILSSNIRFVPPSIKHAEVASFARIRYPLNLGDCFAYALAKDEQCAVLTLDHDFKKTDISVLP